MAPAPRYAPRALCGLLGTALGLLGCAHQVPLFQPESLHGLAGIPIAMGNPPSADSAGGQIHWKLGDGTEADGLQISHTYARAGTFLVTESAADGAGQRTATFNVEVARRSPLMAVPPEAGMAVAFDRFFNRLGKLTALMERAVSHQGVADALFRAQALIGFDPRNPDDVMAAGIDPDKGLAWVTFPEEPNTAYLLVGIFDDQKAEQTLKKALSNVGATFSVTPRGWNQVAIPAQPEVIYRLDRGYLIIRVPGSVVEPPLASEHLVHAPDTGLFDDPGILAQRARIHGDDVEIYLNHPKLAQAQGELGELLGGLTSGLVEVTLGETEISAELDLRATDAVKSRIAALFNSSDAPSLAQHSPRGAALYASYSGDLPQLFSVLASDPSLAPTSYAGFDLHRVAGQLGGSAAAIGYFDASEFLRDLISTGRLGPSGDLLAEVSVKQGALVQVALQLAVAAMSGPSSQKVLPDGRTRIDFTVAGHPSAAAVGPKSVLLSHGTRRFDEVASGSCPDPELAVLQQILPSEAFLPAHAVLYADIGLVLDQLAATGPVPGTSPGELLQAELATRLLSAQLSGFQDAYLVVGPSPDGLQGKARLRLRTGAQTP